MQQIAHEVSHLKLLTLIEEALALPESACWPKPDLVAVHTPEEVPPSFWLSHTSSAVLRDLPPFPILVREELGRVERTCAGGEGGEHRRWFDIHNNMQVESLVTVASARYRPYNSF